MRQEWSIPEKEWFFLLKRMIDEMFDRLDPFPTDGQSLIPMALSCNLSVNMTVRF